eukprot:5129864-Pyramimonas_sp.AAC.1
MDFVEDKESLGRLHKSLNPPPQPADEMEHEGVTLYHPKDLIDAKARHWHRLWAPTTLVEDEVFEAFAE